METLITEIDTEIKAIHEKIIEWTLKVQIEEPIINGGLK